MSNSRAKGLIVCSTYCVRNSFLFLKLSWILFFVSLLVWKLFCNYSTGTANCYYHCFYFVHGIKIYLKTGGRVYKKPPRGISGTKREEATDIKEGYLKKRVVTSCSVFHQTCYKQDDEMQEEMVGARSPEKCIQNQGWYTGREEISWKTWK
jgi:hypothetical protein